MSEAQGDVKFKMVLPQTYEVTMTPEEAARRELNAPFFPGIEFKDLGDSGKGENRVIGRTTVTNDANLVDFNIVVEPGSPQPKQKRKSK